MSKRRLARSSHLRRRLTVEPGALSTGSDAKARPQIRFIAYGDGDLLEKRIEQPSELETCLGKHNVVWIDIEGTEDHDLLRRLGVLFDIHPLCLEAVINMQRPKLEQYNDHFFLVLHQLSRAIGGELISFQIAASIAPGCIVTFHDGPWPLFDQLSERIRTSVGSFRDLGVDYLVYGIVDGVIDEFFPLLETYGETLEKLESEIIESSRRETIAAVHAVKRELLTVRRAMWPMREALNALLRDGPPLFGDNAIIHLRDVYDHAVQIIDFIETYRELGADLMDVYLSTISNRMNEVMKVLTIITTIFVPPTFIAGIYGMNFRHEVSPYNMPELSCYWGYPLCLTCMTLVASAVVGLLWWKGWLGVLSTKNHADVFRK